jgi:ubiquinone/menaquinone biosynthesis C-methylase UbiE
MPIKNLILLDAGCGDGRITLELAIQGAHSIVAIDLSSHVLKNAKKMLLAASSEHMTVSHFIRCDIEQLPFRPSSFDGITCMDTFVHIPNPRDALVELSRALKHDGSLSVNITNKNPLWRITSKRNISLINFFSDIFLYYFPDMIVKLILKLLNKKMIGKHMTETEFKSQLKGILKIEKILKYGQPIPVFFLAITKKPVKREAGEMQ